MLGNLNSLSSLTGLAKAATSIDNKAILSVDVNIVQSKAQVRQTFRNIEELAKTMITEGQQMPIVVSPMDEEGKYTIQKGERRWRAIKHAGIKTIDVIVNYRDQTRADEVAGELIENIQRENLDPIEIAYGVKDLLDNGLSREEIGARIGKSLSYVSSHLTLTKLPERVLELCSSGLVTDVETLNNLRSLNNVNQDRCELVCSIMLSEGQGITRQQSRDILREEKDRKKNKDAGVQTSASDTNPAATGMTHDTEDGEVCDSDKGYTPQANPQAEGALTSGDASSEGSTYKEIQEELDQEILGSAAAPIDADLEGVTTTEDAVSPAKKAEAQVGKEKAQEDITIRVSMLTEMDILHGLLMLKECDNPEDVWVRLDSGKKVKTHASNVEIKKLMLSKVN